MEGKVALHSHMSASCFSFLFRSWELTPNLGFLPMKPFFSVDSSFVSGVEKKKEQKTISPMLQVFCGEPEFSLCLEDLKGRDKKSLDKELKFKFVVV